MKKAILSAPAFPVFSGNPILPFPAVDMETYVPAAITVVRRAPAWSGILLQERIGTSGEVNYPGGIRQHVLYWFLRSARSDVVVEGSTQSVQYERGAARFTPAGRPVSFRWRGKVHVLMLGFQPWFFERIAADLGLSAALPATINRKKLPAGHAACLLMPQLAREFTAHAGGNLVALGLAQAIAVLLLREFLPRRAPKSEPSAPPTAVLRAVQLMRRRLTETLSLEEVASVAGLSPFHFARQFKAATGHPPHDYLVRLRVDRAQQLMREHAREWSLAAIAQESGFADQSHMARHFKRVLGVTPGVFAEARPHRR